MAPEKRKRILGLSLFAAGLFAMAALFFFLLSPPAAARPPKAQEPPAPSLSEDLSTEPNPLLEPSPLPEAVQLSEEELFGQAAFLGNSCVERLFLQGFAPQADFLSRTNLTVSTAFTQGLSRGSGSAVDQLSSGKVYRRIYIRFGENELGWPDSATFASEYARLLDAVFAAQPGARVYVQSIPPVTAAKSARGDFGVTNERIEEYNALLKSLARERGAVFLDIAAALRDASGALPEEASSDGVHMTREYGEKWITYIKKHVVE